MSYKHHENCNTPICAGDFDRDYKQNVVWYAGEAVCQKSPYAKFQKKQIVINNEVKKGTFKHLDEPYNAHLLETRSI
jgi:hypothetical protein